MSAWYCTDRFLLQQRLFQNQSVILRLDKSCMRNWTEFVGGKFAAVIFVRVGRWNIEARGVWGTRGLSMSYAALLFLAVSVCVVGACSRERSRLARFVLDSHFFPLLLQWEGRLTDHCPFRRSRDIYYDQERHKTEKDARHWTCELCGKSFYSEHYLDAHMERKHAERMVTENGVCLADYCDVLRCHAVQHKGQKQAPDSCSENEMLRLRAKCQVYVVEDSFAGSVRPPIRLVLLKRYLNFRG